MMGDNRDNSVDSRIVAAPRAAWGFVPEDNLVARADRMLLSRDVSVGWSDVAGLAARLPVARVVRSNKLARGWCGPWRFGRSSEADFEPCWRCASR